MKKMVVVSLTALLCVPPLVRAQAYRCKQPNGSLSFQDHPCQAGASGSLIGLPPAQGYAVPPSDRPKPAVQRTLGRPDADAALRAQLEALDRKNNCNTARRNVGALQEQRPVYHYGKAGNRVYVEDKDRSATLASEREWVDANCE